jgi:hypothetical protein
MQMKNVAYIPSLDENIISETQFRRIQGNDMPESVNCKEMPETCKQIYDQFNENKKRSLELIREALKKRCFDNKTPLHMKI